MLTGMSINNWKMEKSQLQVKLPQFDESFLRETMRFTRRWDTYNNVSFPFFLADDGYWEYSSLKSDHVLRLKEDPDKGYYLDVGEKEDAC